MTDTQIVNTSQDDLSDLKPRSSATSGCLWGLLGGMGCLIIVPLIAFVVIVGMGLNTIDGVTDGIRDIFAPVTPVYVQISSALVLQQIEGLSQLTTTRYTYSNVVTTQRELPQILRGLYNDRLTMVIAGHITAGIDLSELTEEQISVDGGTLIIQLPPPQLQECYINDQASYVVERETGLFASAAPQLDSEARRFAISEFRRQAIESGILDEANQEAAARLELLLTALPLEGITDIQLIPQTPPTDPPLPDSCS